MNDYRWAFTYTALWPLLVVYVLVRSTLEARRVLRFELEARGTPR